MAKIYVDADACPVKNEAYAIARRLNLIVHVVANQWMNMPDDPMIRLACSRRRAALEGSNE